MYDDDASTTCSCLMTAFPATSKNWWGMQHGLEEVELSDLQTEETASSFSHHAQWSALDNDDAVGHATMSMSVINAHDGECEEIELDFAPNRALQSRLHRLLDMASSPEEDECESMGDSSVLEQRDNDEGGGGNLKTRQASFSSTSSSHVGAPSASFGISSASPTDQPTARWYYDETWDATSASPTSPPSRIYPNHVEIPIG
ncbi:hypothetical protein PsorP6_003368 [Peronosclerospora sorghi]|uniref:Uncharacterized protein n=1 Tax=Peronosclerospora sorghi TaxID=230839 RepID=A0ACC0VJP5_9STRA|nr:hypothetical protein PsorP6_003368 [Peronosclerospora sorghi]